ncbi:MAG: DNA/RNA non-specific endonuclease [Candidatus Thiodiazotropha endolucinida]|nr:DNA/RNA non-specific endonuclease [Candidatus Thiodiazotropha taylori]MCW4225201.1 DNA/RNA non-specific endonuclease [Candidatus Thiodiazotropha endolucinida]MCG7880753.1 DNA/RNA non-specific endonuclease [Candidatus Thiodiazotropha taylori]MCG7886772.1 DNA/RNA non-specific endonuclease [Candidatus Thiodiazotropha taylori]MCG8028160.1 DNA/RNA non-specific endonuclease [Candidatus Thiodiazotropha taylori]
MKIFKYSIIAIAIYSTAAIATGQADNECLHELYSVNPNPEGYDHYKYAPQLKIDKEQIEYQDGGFVSSLTPNYNYNTPLWVAYQINYYVSTRGSNYAPSRHKRLPWPNIKGLDSKRKNHQPLDATYQNAPDKWTVGLFAPRGDMSRHSKAYGCNAHVYANAAPFNKQLYHGIWRGLENYVSSLSNQYGRVWVTTGPIYENKEIEYIGNAENNEQLIGIPDKYFKVIIYEMGLNIHVLSFIYPNNNTKQKNYLSGNCQKDIVYDHSPFIVSLSDIEKATDLTFFPNITTDITAVKDEKAQILPTIKNRYKVGYCM